MNVFWLHFFKAFFLIPFLLIAWYIKRIVEIKLPSGRFKSFLLSDSNDHKTIVWVMIVSFYIVLGYIISPR